MARVLCIGDTHAPFMHPKYPDFLKRIRDEYKCDTVVHIGDLVDHHVASFHTSETDALGLKMEADLAEKQARHLYDLFPDVKLCLGNHDRIPERKAKEARIPQRFLKKITEAYNCPKGWKADRTWEIDGVLYLHGTRCGKTAHVLTAESQRQSICQGHTHCFGGVGYLASCHDLIFGMNVGCGIDIEAYAFRYGIDYAHRPTLGCGVVIDGSRAIFEPMLFERKTLRRPRVMVPKMRRKRA